jgi:uncharacterized protein
VATTTPAQWGYRLLGLAGLVMGFLGILLPGLPATPFFLISSWAFAKGSPELRAWMFRQKSLRGVMQQVEQYERERSLPLAVKLIAVGSAWTSFTVLAVTNRTPWWVTALVGAAATAGTIFMISVPTRPRAEESLDPPHEGRAEVAAPSVVEKTPK